MAVRAFIKDLHDVTAGLTAEQISAQAVEVEVDALVVNATRIQGLLSLRVKDPLSQGGSPTVSVAVMSRTSGYTTLIELTTLVGKRVRVVGTLKKSRIRNHPDG